jgi:ribosomal-protein-alanine N-acetyltransferase
MITATDAETITIQPAGWRDWRAVSNLEQACFALDAWGPIEIFFVLVGDNVRFKAVSQGKLVGFVMGDPRPSQGFAWIATIGVHPDFQRLGVGARLLAAAEAALTTPRIRLTVRQSNTGAIAMYRKFGYQQTSLWAHYYAGGEAGIVMEKQKP